MVVKEKLIDLKRNYNSWRTKRKKKRKKTNFAMWSKAGISQLFIDQRSTAIPITLKFRRQKPGI